MPSTAYPSGQVEYSDHEFAGPDAEEPSMISIMSGNNVTGVGGVTGVGASVTGAGSGAAVTGTGPAVTGTGSGAAVTGTAVVSGAAVTGTGSGAEVTGTGTGGTG